MNVYQKLIQYSELNQQIARIDAGVEDEAWPGQINALYDVRNSINMEIVGYVKSLERIRDGKLPRYLGGK